jgi:glycerol-3-phosphate cytidylyltransferase
MFELFEKLKKDGKKIGFTCGTFDVLHAGHVMMFEESKAHCDYLIVGLLSDPTISRPQKNKPVQSMWERYVQLQAVKVIDYIVPFDTEEDIIQMLEMIQPHIRFVGEDYHGIDFTGKALCDHYAIDIYYNKRTHKYSSTELRSRPEMEPKNDFRKCEEDPRYMCIEMVDERISHIGPDYYSNGKFSPCIGCKTDCKSDKECLIFPEDNSSKGKYPGEYCSAPITGI